MLKLNKLSLDRPRRKWIPSKDDWRKHHEWKNLTT
jgi:hypothetical protein